MATKYSTIITFEDIKKVRPIAQNIQDLERMQPYIRETEMLEIMPVIGAGLYKEIIERRYANLTDNSENQIQDNSENNVILNDEEFFELLEGGYFKDCGKNMQYQDGLITAIAYLTYARAIIQNGINFTAFGIVTKKTETSEPTDDAIIIRASNQAKKTGLAILTQVLVFMSAKNMLPCRTENLRHKRKIKIIGT
jgi:hypothetical protein